MPKGNKKLPQNAKCVFKGVIFEVWQWRQKMFDGSYSIFERLKRPDTCQVIPIVGDKILIQMQEQPDTVRPFPSLPGGRRDGKETALQAAKRELLEESGYASIDWKLWKKQQPHSKIIWMAYTFVARNCKKIQKSCPDAGEKTKAKLIEFDEFLKLSDNPDFYEKELVGVLHRAKFDKKYQKEFKKLLFGKK
jgi:8-oxo-dGTP pyrophosphatase MutT (NUDIX family)